MNLYKDKPEDVSTAARIVKFVRMIPAKYWCVDTRDNGMGQHCILGHFDSAYGLDWLSQLPINHSELARINNGELGYCNSRRRMPGAKLTGGAIKKRLIEFLNKNDHGTLSVQ